MDVRAKVLVAIYGSRCTVTDALISDGTIVAVCGEGHLQPFYGFMPCTEPPILCKVGVWPICYEPGPTLAIPPGRPRGKLGSLLP